jgi:hypothetical protein
MEKYQLRMHRISGRTTRPFMISVYRSGFGKHFRILADPDLQQWITGLFWYIFQQIPVRVINQWIIKRRTGTGTALYSQQQLSKSLLTRSSEMLGNWDLTRMKRLQQKSNTSPGVQGGRFCFLHRQNQSVIAVKAIPVPVPKHKRSAPVMAGFWF